MSEIQTMERTEILIDGVSNHVAQEQDLDDLMQRLVSASNSPSAFVEFVVVGNRRVRVLVTPRTQVVISTETVRYDSRDTGDENAPWGGLYDVDGHPAL
jgi:hypothetical protein